MPATASRACSRPACREPAAVTLTYEYARAHVWLDDLRPIADPHAYDLCADHGARVSVPQGWYLTDRRAPVADGRAGDHAGLLAG